MQRYFRTFFEIEFDPKSVDKWFLGEPLAIDGSEIDAWHFTMGTSYRGPTPRKVPIEHAGAERQFNIAALGMPVVSIEVASAIQSIQTSGVETFPVHIEGASREYAILNVLNRADCVDEDKSEIAKFEADDGRPDLIGEYRMIINLTIDPSRTKGHRLFRVARYEVALIASESIKRAIESFSDLGIIFQPVVR